MGALTLITMIATFFVASQRENIEVAVVSVTLVAILMLTFGTLIIKNVTSLAQITRLQNEFVTIASHQLRAPLSQMRWILDFLLGKRAGKLNPKLEEYLKTLRESNQRMITLANNLLDVSRIEEGRMKLNPQPTNLVPVVKSVIRELKIFARANNVEISFEFEKDLPKVLVDPIKIKMVIFNLVNNAIKYIKEGGQVNIRLKTEGPKVIFEAQDTGVGIPREEQSSIFQKFFRSKSALKNQTIGSGLGLYIAKAVVESSKGRIWFKSKEGEGSTFYFSLPKVF